MDSQMQHPVPKRAPASSMQYVGFWTRMAAYTTDGIVIFAISMFLGVVHLGGLRVLAGIFYFVYFWSQKNGQTLGNMVMGIRVIREDGKPIDVLTGIIRYYPLCRLYCFFACYFSWFSLGNLG